MTIIYKYKFVYYINKNEYQKVITAVILTNIILDQTQFNTKPKQPK